MTVVNRIPLLGPDPTRQMLLRGVNAGARNRIRMDALRAALEAAGFTHVRTLLQSGNVVVGHEGTQAQVEAGVRGILEARFNLDVAVLVRDERVWAEIVAETRWARLRLMAANNSWCSAHSRTIPPCCRR